MVMVMAREKEIEKLPIVFVLLLVLLLLRCCLLALSPSLLLPLSLGSICVWCVP